MDRKRRLFNLIENYVNEYSKHALEDFYGHGASLRLKNINYITNDKSVFVNATIILGSYIDEFSLEPVVAELLLQNALQYFFPVEYRYKFFIEFDS